MPSGLCWDCSRLGVCLLLVRPIRPGESLTAVLSSLLVSSFRDRVASLRVSTSFRKGKGREPSSPNDPAPTVRTTLSASDLSPDVMMLTSASDACHVPTRVRANRLKALHFVGLRELRRRSSTLSEPSFAFREEIRQLAV